MFECVIVNESIVLDALDIFGLVFLDALSTALYCLASSIAT